MAKAKKAHLVKASVLNAASDEKGAGFYVIAAAAPEVNKDTVLSAFKCGDCTTQFSALAGSQPFCVTCGSEEVDVEDGEGALSPEDIGDDENLANVECSSCGTHNIVTLETASALGTKMHCVTCGTEIEYMPPTEGEDVEENLEDVELSADGDDLTDEEMDDVDLTINDEEDETEEVEAAAAATDAAPKAAETDVKAPAAPVDNVKPADAPVVVVEEPKPAAEPIAMAASDDSEDADESAESAEDDADDAEETADAAASDDEMVGDDAAGYDEDEEVDFEESCLAAIVQGDLSIERYGDRIVAFVGGIPVGHLTRANAGQNEGVFATTAFANAIKHTVRQVGAEKALAHYNFQLAAVKFPVPELVNERVTAGVEKAQREIASKIKDVSDDFRQAVGIVAAGLNKGWFKGSPHVLKEAFKNELAASGFKGASRVVDKVFAQYNDPYHKSLFEKAQELLSKSVEFRNELATSIGDMNYQPTSVVEAGDEVDMDETVPTEARLEGAGLRRGGKTQETSSLAVSDIRSTVVDLRSRNGGRIF